MTRLDELREKLRKVDEVADVCIARAKDPETKADHEKWRDAKIRELKQQIANEQGECGIVFNYFGDVCTRKPEHVGPCCISFHQGPGADAAHSVETGTQDRSGLARPSAAHFNPHETACRAAKVQHLVEVIDCALAMRHVDPWSRQAVEEVESLGDIGWRDAVAAANAIERVAQSNVRHSAASVETRAEVVAVYRKRLTMPREQTEAGGAS